jgi:hypothetical protein
VAKKNILFIMGAGGCEMIITVRVENPISIALLGNTWVVKSFPTATTNTSLSSESIFKPLVTVLIVTSNLHSGKSLRYI